MVARSYQTRTLEINLRSRSTAHVSHAVERCVRDQHKASDNATNHVIVLTVNTRRCLSLILSIAAILESPVRARVSTPPCALNGHTPTLLSAVEQGAGTVQNRGVGGKAPGHEREPDG